MMLVTSACSYCVCAGVQGALATVDARRPPGVVATMLQTLLKYRNNVKVTFDTYALEPTPGGLSPDIVKVCLQQKKMHRECCKIACDIMVFVTDKH